MIILHEKYYLIDILKRKIIEILENVILLGFSIEFEKCEINLNLKIHAI